MSTVTVMQAAKRKEKTTKAINLISSLIPVNGDVDLEVALASLKKFQKRLLQ
jgi:hypothetical protein